MKLSESTVLVAGGASGLGEATVRRLAAAGASCIILDRDIGNGEQLARELPDQAMFVHGDITETDDVNRALDCATTAPLRLAVICAFAGGGSGVLHADGTPADLAHFRHSLEVNVTGTFNVLRLAAARMATNPADENSQRGLVVTTSSIAAFDGMNGQIAYACGKAAVSGMSLPAARDLAPFGIRIMSIAPGLFLTPVVANLPAPYLAQITDMALFPHRPGDPDEYARLVEALFDNPYLNAETIRIDSGSRLACTTTTL